MKNIHIILVVLFVLVFGWMYKQQDKTPSTNAETSSKVTINDSFEKNQECQKYKSGIIRTLETKILSFGTPTLEQIFYSPQKDACLYVRYTAKNGYFMKDLYDIQKDGPSAVPLESCDGIHPLSEIHAVFEKEGDLMFYQEKLRGCDDFEEKIAEYK